MNCSSDSSSFPNMSNWNFALEWFVLTVIVVVGMCVSICAVLILRFCSSKTSSLIPNAWDNRYNIYDLEDV